MKVAFYKGRNRSLLALSLGLFLPLCLGVALLIQAYIKSASIEIMNSWLQTEAVDIQEGNLLSSVTKHRRLLMSSALVTAVSLYDVEEIGRRSGPIIFFGERSGDSNSMDTILVPPGEIVSTSSAIFQEQIFYRFPEMPSLVLVFHVQPKLAWVVFGIIQSVAFIFLVAALSMLTWARHKEEETRIELLKYAINELITKKKPSEALSHEIPAISSAWEELRLTMDKLAQELTNQATNAAIAQTTQMLAHDTKQPFTQLKMGLELLEHCQLSDEAAETVGLIKRSVGKSLAKVSALIADIMAIGSTSSELFYEQKVIKDVIAESMHDLCHIWPNAEIRLENPATTDLVVNIDSFKIQRVLSNLIGNALEATKGLGPVWVKALGDSRHIQVCVGNGNSFIEHEHLANIFESFYTRGKKGGTGLGLAIAKKYVRMHGGTIWCESQKTDAFPLGQVEFSFTLPTS